MTRFSAMLSCLLLLAGCATWVNIPAQRGDMASHDPNTATARKVAVVALTYAVAKYPPGEAYVVIMPEGTRAQTMTKMLAELPAGATTQVDPAGRLPVFRVAGIRLRGWRGQVDIVPPEGIKPKRLMSVYLKHDIADWYVHRDHLWNMPLDKALMLARPAPRIEPIESAQPQDQPQPEDQPQPQAQPEDQAKPKAQPQDQAKPEAQPEDQPKPAQNSTASNNENGTFVENDKPIDITPKQQGVMWQQ